MSPRIVSLLIFVPLLSFVAGAAVAEAREWHTLDGKAPLVIAHRGASGYRPEHTLVSYALAIEQGADFVEPDLVATKDGHLVARHEPVIDATTDVVSLAQFQSRKTTRTIDGRPVTGFFVSDFTLEELKQLRAVQPNAARSKEFDGRFPIPTFEEILDLVKRESARLGRSIGVYPETKHPAFHLALGLPLEDRLLTVLRAHNLDNADAPVFIQSFESANLQYLRTKTKVRLVQLLDDGALQFDGAGVKVTGVVIPQFGDPRGGTPPADLDAVARYADAIGPWKRQILRDVQSSELLRTTLVAQAHAARLRVHAYTFRNEAATLAPQYGSDPLLEYRQFFELGVDGVFSDFPDTARRALLRRP